MAKKTSVKRVSDKSKGKEIEKKLIKDLRSPKKTSPKKKINKNVSTKTATKTRVKAKVKVKVEKNTKRTKAKVEVEKKTKKTIIPKKTEAKKKIKKITSPGPIKKKTLSKIKDKILPKSVKETGTKKIAEKPLRKVKVKVEAKTKTQIKTKTKAEAEAEVKVGRKGKPETKIRKIASKIEKKVPAEKTKKIPSKKPVKKTSEKAKVEDKIAVRKKTKAKPGERVKKVIVQVQEKALPAAVKEIEARRPVKEEAKAKVEVQVKAKEKEKEKEKVTPSIEEKIPLIPQEEMPSEYGENDITLMIVDPYKLFAFWEVREDTLKIFKGDLQIRLYDITGVDFSKNDANSYLDLPVTERMGRTYIDAVPEKEFIADIGIVYEGIFITIARSNIVSTPRASVSEGEGLLPPKLYETGIRIGY